MQLICDGRNTDGVAILLSCMSVGITRSVCVCGGCDGSGVGSMRIISIALLNSIFLVVPKLFSLGGFGSSLLGSVFSVVLRLVSTGGSGSSIPDGLDFGTVSVGVVVG